MTKQTIRILLQLHGMSAAQLAKMAGVSRQAVSLWLNGDNESVELRAGTLKQLSDNLSISIDDLLSPIPYLSDPAKVEELEAQFLWDRLYPSLVSFAGALITMEPKAVARLTQCLGLFEAACILGKRVWRAYPEFKRYILPVRVKQFDIVWTMQKNLELI